MFPKQSATYAISIMVVFSRNTVEIVRLDDKDFQRPKPNMPPNTYYREKAVYPVQDKDKKNILQSTTPHEKAEWHYIVTRIVCDQDKTDCYRIVLNYLLGLAKSDTILKYVFVFNIVPAIIKHTNGCLYILVRIKINHNSDVTIKEVLTRLFGGFNPLYTHTLHMTAETDTRNVRFFQWLFVKEYIPFKKEQQHTRSKSHGSIPLFEKTDDKQIGVSAPMYATASLDVEEHIPPMPRTLDIYAALSTYDSSYNYMYPSRPNKELLQYINSVASNL